ncbi:MAG: TRAP transporter small permease [Bacillota bacterium]|nr:TRAP transporter small permease [Bacillota bacterium]
MFKAVNRIVNFLSHYTSMLAGFLILIMAIVTTYGVIMRYVFQSPEYYSVEISLMFMVWSFVLAAAEVEKRDQHIKVDILSQLMPEKGKYFLFNIFTPIAGLIFAGTITWRSYVNAIYSLQIGEVSATVVAVPLFPVKIVVSIGYGLLCLVLLVRLVKGLISLAGGFQNINGEDEMVTPNENV